MGSWRRLAALVLVGAVVGVPTLVGCTPGPKRLTALRASGDGQVEILLALCDDEWVSTLSIYETNVESGGQSREWRVQSSGGWRPDRVVPFTPPPGATVAADELGGVVDGQSYSLYARAADGTSSRFTRVGFSPADLAALASDKVWIAAGNSGGTAVSLEEFEEDAGNACD